MSPRRILLTGASGFVARHLRPLLALAFPRAELTLCGSRPGMVPLDVTDRAAVNEVVEAVKPEACVHLAAVSAVPAARRDPEMAWRVNLHGTLALAWALQRHAPDCTLLYASSAEIYGATFRRGVALDETALPAPGNTYAATKAAADLALGGLAAEGLKVVRVRPFNHTGAGQSADFVVPAFARQVMRIAAGRQPPVVQVGALEPCRDFLDVRDVCAAYVACLQRRAALPPGVIINIASGQPRRIGDILSDLLRLAGVKAVPQAGAGLMRPTDLPVACGDPSLARRLLDWAPRFAWEDTLRTVLDDWRDRSSPDEPIPPRTGRQG